ncbi:imm11 family protein [Acinetobacter seifertii]|uniref:imm11 family protein n=1 Tax=Acinetobacter seifertii TaxID=1530123 RepID=UPI003EE0D351
MSNNVWTTTIMFDENYRFFELTFPGLFDYLEFNKLNRSEATAAEKEKKNEMTQKSIEIINRYHKGEKLNSENAPTILYTHGFGKTVKLPSFFRTQDGFVILTEACANVLKKFRLGQSALYPLSFFDIKLNEPVNDQTYYFLNIAELRSYLCSEYCTKKLRTASYTKHEGYQLFNLYHAFYKDHAIAIKKDAVNCDVDLWRDPELNNSIFMSDELKKALDDAQLSDAWQLFLCDLK